MPPIPLTIEVPETFTDGAEEGVREGVSLIATKVIAEASRRGVDSRHQGGTVYRDDVEDAIDFYLAPPTAWDRAKAWIRAAVVFLTGTLTIFVPMAFDSLAVIAANLAWFVVALLVGVNLVAWLAFFAYKDT